MSTLPLAAFGTGAFPVASVQPAVSSSETNPYLDKVLSLGDYINQKIWVANFARSLDLPDHAIFFLQNAYTEISKVFDDLLKLAGGGEIPPQLKEALAVLKVYKNRLLEQIHITLIDFGVRLSVEEIGAILSPDKHFDGQQTPGQQQAVQEFYGFNGEQRKSLTEGAAKEIAGALPKIIMDKVAHNLSELAQDATASVGAAWNVTYNALTQLELAKGLLRLANFGANSMLNGFGDEARKLLPIIQQLERMSYEVYAQVESRSSVRSQQSLGKGQNELRRFVDAEQRGNNPLGGALKNAAESPAEIPPPGTLGQISV